MTDNIEENDDENNEEQQQGYTESAKESAEAFGKGVGKIAMAPPKLAWMSLEGILIGVTRVVPGGSKLWKKVIKIGYGNLKQTSGCDRILHVMKQGRIIHRPIYWNSERRRWETKNGGNWWNGGQQHNYLGPGNVPCSWAASRATELGSQVQSEIAEALDVGAGREVYRDATLQIDNVTLDAKNLGNGSGNPSAVADGGTRGLSSYVTVRNPGVLQDYVIDLNEIHSDDEGNLADGRLVSMESYYETYPETIDSEEMQNQEDRGILAAMKDDNMWKKAMWFMALAFAFVLLWEFGPAVLGNLLGGAGGGSAGGGGGGIPMI